MSQTLYRHNDINRKVSKRSKVQRTSVIRFLRLLVVIRFIRFPTTSPYQDWDLLPEKPGVRCIFPVHATETAQQRQCFISNARQYDIVDTTFIGSNVADNLIVVVHVYIYDIPRFASWGEGGLLCITIFASALQSTEVKIFVYRCSRNCSVSWSNVTVYSPFVICPFQNRARHLVAPAQMIRARLCLDKYMP